MKQTNYTPINYELFIGAVQTEDIVRMQNLNDLKSLKVCSPFFRRPYILRRERE